MKGQFEINSFYAQTVDAEVVESFEDNGASGKNFLRKGWKDCEAFLKKHRGKIDYLIVWKYDRFGRNLSESLAMIEKIEQRWNIKILASAEPIYLSPTDPYFFKERASRLLDAHFERLRISDRAKMGNWMAKQQGRFIGRAPFGFLNIRNSNNKPDIEKDYTKEEVFKAIGDSFFMCNDEMKKVVLVAKEAGYNRRGKSAIQRLLMNSIYYGLLVVPAYKNNPERIVSSNAGGWWPASWYEVAKERIRGGERKVSLRPELPLRGLVKCCVCGNKLTGSYSKGNGGSYYYYKCCPGSNVSSVAANSTLLSILKKISLPKVYVEVLLEMVKEEIKNTIKGKKAKEKQLMKEIEDLLQRIDNLEEKYINDDLAALTYKKWHGIYTRDLAGKEMELERIKKDEGSIWKKFEENKDKLCNLDKLYESLDILEKRKFFTLIFGKGVVMHKEKYATNYLPKLLKFNLKNIKELEWESGNKKWGNVAISPLVPGAGIEPARP